MKFNPFRKLIPKSNRVLATLKSFPVWLRPNIKPWVTKPEDWFVIKLSGDRVGYVEAKSLQ
jgi:hypothetical protein